MKRIPTTRNTIPHRIAAGLTTGIFIVVIGLVATGCAPAVRAASSVPVTLLAAGVLGDDPFTTEPASTDVIGLEGETRGGSRTGDTPGLYGGTRSDTSCDKDQLITFLTKPGNEDKADAWAKALNINRADIPKYIRALTPLILRTDTLVKNHGFKKNIGLTVFHALLEAGIAVLVDRYGRPTVRCSCGNPLTAPDIEPRQGIYDQGTPWDAFDQKKITVIEQGAQMSSFVFRDVENGDAIERQSGTDGQQDKPGVIPPTTQTTTPEETSTSGSESTTPDETSTSSSESTTTPEETSTNAPEPTTTDEPFVIDPEPTVATTP